MLRSSTKLVSRILVRERFLAVTRPGFHPFARAPWNQYGVTIRAMSSEANKSNPEQPVDNNNTNEDATKEIVLTPGQKVVAGARLSLWAGMAGLAAICAYYIGKELIPTKMSPNSVFSNSLEVVREHADVKRIFGEPLKGYGRDHGGHREGRRNFIEHTEYTSDNDGSKRTRVRYNLEGQHGHASVFAEVSNQMSSGEFVYILVQDKHSGRVITVVDNRAALTAQKLAGGNKDAQSIMSQLLQGGGQK